MKPTISNNFNLTDDQIEKFKSIFPHTRGQQLSVIFGLNNNQVSCLRKKLNLQKDKNVFVLTPKEVNSFKNEFYQRRNDELMKRYGLTRSQLDYLRKKIGLRKRIFRIKKA